MAVKKLETEGVYSCKITSAQKTRKKQVLLALKTSAGSTKLCLDTINRPDHQGIFSAILDAIRFSGIIQRPEEVIGGCFQAYLKPRCDFTDVVWLMKETKNAE